MNPLVRRPNFTQNLTVGLSALLIVTYALGMLFWLKTLYSVFATRLYLLPPRVP